MRRPTMVLRALNSERIVGYSEVTAEKAAGWVNFQPAQVKLALMRP